MRGASYAHMHKLSIKEIIGMILVAALFLGASYGSERFAVILENLVSTGSIFSMMFYVLILIGIVLTPLATTLPLIPIATTVWGGMIAGSLTLLAWAISSNLCVRIGRKFGRRLVLKILPFSVIKQFADMVPERNLVGGVTLLSMLGAPIDIVGYAIGLFTNLSPLAHTIALTLGAAPFIFFLTYTVTLPIVYQTYIVGFMIIVWFVVYSHLKQKSATKTAHGSESAPPVEDTTAVNPSHRHAQRRRLIQ
jgi:uncharacterized membrane protein YdjX (TVP38/TMEM64 family)